MKLDVDRRSDGDPLGFRVAIDDGRGTSEHSVTLARGDYERLSNDEEPAEQFVERCFLFLLERESKESILATFDIAVISRYFPEFETEIGRVTA